ncbi:hypothetical protein Hdeb2414_s0005g00177331 [Helianthus debilis subsp. tardiflorus]
MDEEMDGYIEMQRLEQQPVDPLLIHPYLEFPPDSKAVGHCAKLTRMHVASQDTVEWVFIETIGEMAIAHEFISIDSPWNRLFELSYMPTYRELLVEFLSPFSFHPCRGGQSEERHDYAHSPPPEVSFRIANVARAMTLAQFEVHCTVYLEDDIAIDLYTLVCLLLILVLFLLLF